MKKFILVGANFINLGATALAYTTVSEIKRKYPDCEVYMLSNFDFMNDHSDLNFKVIGLNKNAWNIFMHYNYCPSYIKGIIKKIIKKSSDFSDVKKMQAIFQNCDGVFDISGYSLSSQWGEEQTNRHLDIVEKFLDYGVSYYFMPQSFGPFNYQNNSMKTVERISNILSRAKAIFAREKEGYDYLKELIGESNLYQSCDLVLQAQEIDEKSVFKTVEKKQIRLNTTNNVAMIPNMRNFDHGNKEDVICLYKKMIIQMKNMGRNIYLISHSKEDHEACKIIKDMFADDDSVIYIKENMDVFLFEKIVAQMDFAIASRFHSIVHAYKNAVPCIALGWATKYHELLNLVDQGEYVLDVRNMDKNDAYYREMIERMNNNFKNESELIQNKVEEIQSHNCFDRIDF